MTLVLHFTSPIVRVCHGATAPHVHDLVNVWFQITHEHLAHTRSVGVKGGRGLNAELAVLGNVLFYLAILSEVNHLA